MEMVPILELPNLYIIINRALVLCQYRFGDKQLLFMYALIRNLNPRVNGFLIRAKATP